MTHPKLERGRPTLSFYLYLAHRVNIVAHPGMAILTVLAVAAATALAVGVEIASRAVREELSQTARAILGNADLEVVAGNRGVPEELIEKVASVPGVFEASPVITEVVRVVGGPLDGLALNLIGVDLLAKRQMRAIEVTRDRVAIRDPLRLLVKPGSVIIAASLAERLRVGEGELLTVRSPVGVHDVVVEGLMERGGLGDAYAGQIGVMDVWSLQHLLDARGFVDRIEVTVAPDRDVEGVLPLIRERAAGMATTRRAMQQESWVASTFGALDLAAWGIAALASMVAALLAYTAIAHVVDSRIGDLALMQCAGMGHQGVQLLVAIDALLLALVGAIAGSAVGVAAAPLLVGALSSMSEHLQQLPVRAADPSPTTALIAVAFSVTVALLGGAPHALRARTSHPLDLIQVHRDSSRELPSQRYLALRAVVLASGALASWLALGMPAAIRLVGVLLLGLAAVALCGGPALRELARLLRPRLVRVRPMGALVGVSLPAGSYALAASLAVTSAVLAGATAVLCVIQSLLGTMDDDLEVRYGHGALVASLASGSRSSALVLPDSIDLIRRISGITDVAEYYDSTLFFQGQEFAIRALSTSALFRNGSLLEDETPIEDVRQALLRGEVVACTTFVHHFRVAVGHEIALDTHAGPRTFRVGGIVAGFGASTGSLLMDVHTFDRHFRRSGASFLQIWADRPLSQIFEEIARQTADIQPLFFSSGADLREVSRRLAGRFAGLLYSLVAVAGCFAGIGVLAIGTSAVMARREDLMLLQICGASPLTVGAVVLLDSFALVAAAAIPSVPLGLASASVAIDLFKEGYGWALRPHATVGPLTVVLAGVLGCAAVAGVVPAWASTRLLDRGRLSAP